MIISLTMFIVLHQNTKEHSLNVKTDMAIYLILIQIHHYG